MALMSYGKPGGLSGGGGGLPKPRGPMLTDKMPMTGPSPLSKPPAMRAPMRRPIGNRKMMGPR